MGAYNYGDEADMELELWVHFETDKAFLVSEDSWEMTTGCGCPSHR
jgi:hypothetical protein